MRRCTGDKATKAQMLRNLKKASKIVARPDSKTRQADSRTVLLPITLCCPNLTYDPSSPPKRHLSTLAYVLPHLKNTVLILFHFILAINRMFLFSYTLLSWLLKQHILDSLHFVSTGDWLHFPLYMT